MVKMLDVNNSDQKDTDLASLTKINRLLNFVNDIYQSYLDNET